MRNKLFQIHLPRRHSTDVDRAIQAAGVSSQGLNDNVRLALLAAAARHALLAIKELLDRVMGKSIAKVEAEISTNIHDIQPNFPAMLEDFERICQSQDQPPTPNGDNQ